LLLGVTKQTLRRRQKTKKEKAGGFNEGLILLQTRNPTPSDVVEKTNNLFENLPKNIEALDAPEIFELAHKIDRWSDKRDHKFATEVIMHLSIPIVRDSWNATAPEAALGADPGNFALKINGRRSGSKYHIEVSIFTRQVQLRLFDENE
jgi:hypothetical protein